MFNCSITQVRVSAVQLRKESERHFAGQAVETLMCVIEQTPGIPSCIYSSAAQKYANLYREFTILG